MSLFALSGGDAADGINIEENGTRNQLETYMLAYVIDQHVLPSKENKTKKVLVGIGDPVDGELKLPDVEVLKSLNEIFPDAEIETLRFLGDSKKKVEKKADEVIVTVNIITCSQSVVGKEITISAVVEVHCNYGPLNAFGEAYQVAYYDGFWAIERLKALYVS